MELILKIALFTAVAIAMFIALASEGKSTQP
jgi:hypothetical protein